MIVEIATSPAGVALPATEWVPRVLRAPRPDGDVRVLLARLSLYPTRPGPGYSLARARRHWQLAIKAYGSRETGVSVVGRREVGLRIYFPNGSPPSESPGAAAGRRPVLVWMHGGGFILGDLYTAGGTCRALARRSGAIVVAVDYRLAPEHPLTVAHSDCLAGVEWVVEHAAELGGDPGFVAVGGDSAGGTLAACVAQRARELGIPLALQLLVYPATDLAGVYGSHAENADGYLLTQTTIEWYRSHLRAVCDLGDPVLSPLLASDVAGVAPAVILTAGFDPLRDEGLAYAARLREAGVATRTLHYADQIHGFVSFDRVVHGARDALDRLAGSLRDAHACGEFVPPFERRRVVQAAAPRSAVSRGELLQRARELQVAQLMALDWVGSQARAALTGALRIAGSS